MQRTEYGGKIFLLTFAIFLLALQTPSAWSQATGEQGIMVGRISFIDGGQLLRYVPEQKDWVVVVKDAPFGMHDALYAGDNVKAEFNMPNSTWIRVGSDTQIQLVALEQGVMEADVASGTARFYNKSRDGVIKVTTPFGYVVAPAETSFDLYVGDQSAEVVSLQGTVDFIHDPDQTKYQVTAGSSSIVADGKQVTSGPGQAAIAWAEWNTSRDSMWAKRSEVKGQSARYLPPDLQYDAYDLDQSGRWERVSYEGHDYDAWHPVGVDPDWAPYTVGRWSDYYGDNAWIPEEPFGYATMHYGNWLWVNNGWFWAPPVVGVGIAYGWYPGRVGWLYSDANVGWFPLAPSEPYYGHHRWGGDAVVVNNVTINEFSGNVNNYRFANQAVVVPQNTLYSANNYSGSRLRNVGGQTIASSFHAAPVLSDRTVKNFSGNGQRFAFTNQAPAARPGPGATTRIAHNTTIAAQASRVNPQTIQQTAARARPGTISQTANVVSPTIRNRPVNPSSVKAAGEPALPQKGARVGSPQGTAQQGPGGSMARPATPQPPTKQQQSLAKPGGVTPGPQSQRQAVAPTPQAQPPRQQAVAPSAQPQPQRQAVTPKPQAQPPRQQAVAPSAQPQPQRQAVTPKPQAQPPRQQAVAPRAQPQPQRQAVTPRPQAQPPRQQAVAPRAQPQPQVAAPRPQAQPPRQQAVAPRAQPQPQVAAPRPQAQPPRQQAVAPRAQPQPQVAAPRPQAAPPKAASAPAQPGKKCPPGVNC